VAPSVQPVLVEVHLDEGELARSLQEDARRGLSTTPKALPPKWFYDERGSRLFERITHLPEYYPTRREREILEARAGELASGVRPDTLIELGSGFSSKTRLLLDAFAGDLRRFVPFDVSEPTLRQASEAIAREHPGLRVHAVVGDFQHHVGLLPRGGRRLIAFLGSTVGNLTPDERAKLLADLAGGMEPDDALLLGTDLVKDVGRLEAAYNDRAGVTAEFNLNVLRVLNRELDADFGLERFSHRALWVPEREWIEMRLRAEVSQEVRLPAVGLTVAFEEGEELRTEMSAKFRREDVEAELAAAGLEPRAWWTDRASDFALSLAGRA